MEPVRRPIRERPVRHLGELARPEVEERLSSGAREAIERRHPLRQVVEALAVAVPFELLVHPLAQRALGKGLADEERLDLGERSRRTDRHGPVGRAHPFAPYGPP
jgi:hypothetical protein